MAKNKTDAVKASAAMDWLTQNGYTADDIKALGLEPHELEILGEAAKTSVEKITIELDTRNRLPEQVWKAVIQDAIDSNSGDKTMAQLLPIILTAARTGLKLYTMGSI